MRQISALQRQRRLLALFIIASIALHLMLMGLFFLPKYLARIKPVAVVVIKSPEKKPQPPHVDPPKHQLAEVKSPTTGPAAENAALDVKEQLKSQLRSEFQSVVADQFKGADADEIWSLILGQMTPGLDEYSREVVETAGEGADLDKGMTDLQAKMLAELAAQLRSRSKMDLANSFVSRVQQDVAPKIIDYYRRQLQSKMGDALRDEAVRIVREDAEKDKEKRKAVAHALGEALRQSTAAVSDINSAKKKIDEAQKIAELLHVEGKGDKGDEKVAAAVRDGQEAVAKATNTVAEAGQNLREAAERADGMAADVQQAIHAARDDVDRAGKDIATAADSHNAKVDDFIKSQGKAADSAKELGDAIKLAQENLTHDEPTSDANARLAIKHSRDKALKPLIEKAFWEQYADHLAPKLADKMTSVFKKALDDAGVKDDTITDDLANRVRAALVDGVADKIRAGEVGTEPMSKILKLDQLADAPAAGPATGPALHTGQREAEVAGRIEKATRDLIHGNIDTMGENALSDDAVVRSLRDSVTGKHAPSKGDEDAGGLGGFAARLDRLADDVKTGRTDLSAAGGGAGGVGAAAGVGIGGIPRPHLPGLPEISHGPQLRNHWHIPDEAAYAKLTAGIHDRDKEAARGQVFERQSGPAAGLDRIALNPSNAVQVRPAAILVPAETKVEPVGQPQKSDPYVPKFKSIRFAAIPYRTKPITIDGDLSDWKDVPELPLTPATEIAPPGSNLKIFPQAVKVQWDNTGFYLAYDVKDADGKITKTKPGDFWEADGIEFWVDTLNTKEKYRTKCSHQFWAWVDGAIDNPAQVGGEARSWPGEDEYLPLGRDIIKTASRKTDAGWTIEVFVPAAKFRMLDLQPGRILGMNFSICTGTDLYYYWAGTTKIATARRPDTWGDVLLAGSAGRLECLNKLTIDLSPGETTKPVNAVQIGQPLRVRVTDGDMNLSETARDHLAVTVATHRGDRRTIILEETGNSTGIFEVGVPTKLDTGTAVDGTLSLVDGDQIDITYIDQYRPDGSRDVPVKLTLPVASAVTRVAEK